MRAFCFFLLISISSIVLSQESTISNSIPAPHGYARETYPNGSYSHWMQHLQLKTKPVIMNYKSQAVESGLYQVFGVVRMPLLFQSDLEQCADFAMRFWAEYHKATGKLDKLYLFDYSGQKNILYAIRQILYEFSERAFANTNSHSLKNGCRSIAANQIVPGDMFIQNERGGIGHVSVVLDVCRSKQGKKLFLIGYSFMPAQEFHVEKASDKYGIEGWFTSEGYTQYLLDNLNLGNRNCGDSIHNENTYSCFSSLQFFSPADPIAEWNRFEKSVRDQTISERGSPKGSFLLS